MIVKVSKSPWWHAAYYGCCVGMIACGIWADGDPNWLTAILIPTGLALMIVAMFLGRKIFRD